MQVPLLDLKAQYQQIKPEIDAALQEVITSQHFILGPVLERFEKKMAQYIGAKYAIGVASGSDALVLALMALDIKPGDEVITTPFSFFATAGSISRLGARPVFVDIEPDTFNINPDRINDVLTKSKNHKAKAIMPVHIFGQCADMQPIMEIARRHNLSVVEDAAQAIGAVYKHQKAGALGQLGCFSFFPSKNLGGWGDAGLVTTSDERLAQKTRSLRVHGSGSRLYYHDYIGINSRLDAIQAAVLSVKLTHLDEWNQARQRNARKYEELLVKAKLEKKIIPPATKPGCNHIYHQYTVRVTQDRDELKNFLQKQNIGTAVYYPLPLHLQECFGYLGYKAGSFPESEKAAHECLSLPVYPELTVAMQSHVVNQIVRFFREK